MLDIISVLEGVLGIVYWSRMLKGGDEYGA